ncbi:hypothetical protein WKI65_38365 [Streptomyces sp. MS1.AVA.3]|uniref:hypothetical protein n=1 Tax=Streptomyces decoyicus TaxID=249567 RepID=UPI0030BDAB6A
MLCPTPSPAPRQQPVTWTTDGRRTARSAGLPRPRYAYLESTGQRLTAARSTASTWPAGRPTGPIDCFVDLGWRYWRSAERYLADGQSWFEVLPATSRQPLNALHITPAARP